MHWERLGDYTAEDWERFLPCSYDEYVAPVKEMLAELRKGEPLHPGYPDRDALLRPTFNDLVPPCGERSQAAVDKYYLSDWYQRVLAFETERQGGLSVMEGKLLRAWQDHRDEPIFVGAEDIGTETGGKFKMLDHGFGSGLNTYTVMGMYPEAEYFIIDFPSPSSKLFVWAMSEFLPSYKITPIWAPFEGAFDEVSPCNMEEEEIKGYKNPFDFVVSHEVLEHCFDPIGEAQRLSDASHTGSILFISVFFNSICGKNPSHLDEHIKFQDWVLWFFELEQMGLYPFKNDPRGVCKLFKKVEVKRNYDPGLELSGDTVVEDWEKFLPCTYDEYVAPVVEQFASGRTREEMYNEGFTSIVPPVGERSRESVLRFYAQSDIFRRVSVYEIPRENRLLSLYLSTTGCREEYEKEPLMLGLRETCYKFGDTFSMLEHGCGYGFLSFLSAIRFPHASFTMVDAKIPPTELLEWALKTYMPTYKFNFKWAPFEPDGTLYDFIVSHEVLEHCFNPLEEVNRLAVSLRSGGLAFISVFFSSCLGQNITHLVDNEIYQERSGEMWFDELASIGLVKYKQDPRGVWKLFRKV